MHTPNVSARPSRRKQILAAVVVALLILALLLLRLQCHPASGFDYFRAKAETLGGSAERIIAFVRDDIHSLPYRGDARGALAALWDGSGSPEEKVALANALLAHASSPRTTTLDEVAPNRDRSGELSASTHTILITHRVTLPDGASESKLHGGPVGDLVGEVHSIEVLAGDKTRFTIRGTKEQTVTVSHAGGVSEEIIFSVLGSEGPPIQVTRELWHRDNRIGRTAPQVGDRHDFVVLPSRVTKYVREKEELLLKQRGRDGGDDATHYLGLLDYALLSDAALAQVEKVRGVRAMMELPRVLILSRFETGGEPGYAIDLRLNRTSFEGEPVAAYLATQMRSFAESGLEDSFLTQWSGGSSTSAFKVFSQLRDDFPNSGPRRIETIVTALGALAEHGGLDGRVRFRARPADGRDAADLPAVVVTREGTGLRVRGGPVHPGFARKLASTDVHIPFAADGALDTVFDSLPDAAVAVEVALLASPTKPAVSPAYVLETDIACGTEPLVTPQAQFLFGWGEGAGRTEQRITVQDSTLGLDVAWRLQTGARPSSGTRSISNEALINAATHNPWYRAGASMQNDVTSFCVSRRVLGELKAGRPIDLTIQGRYTERRESDSDKRPVEWSGTATPAGTGTARVRINGRMEEVPCVRATVQGAPIAIIDDPLFPVGMADRLIDVSTSIRGKLVDRAGIGIASATVELDESSGPVKVTTWADGGFRLPPSSIGGYTRLKLRITLRGALLGEPEVDLSAPGREPVVVPVDRPRRSLVFLSPDAPGELDSLPVSDEVKRHVRADLAAGSTVVIPDQMITSATGLETIGYYAYDVASGHIVGVTEDGLHGCTDSFLIQKIQEQLGMAKGKLSPPKSPLVYIHMYRGANTAAWTYSAYRLEGQSHVEAILTVVEQMKYWEKATNMLSLFKDATKEIPFTRHDDLNSMAGDKAAGEISKLISKSIGGVNDDWAKRGFMAGYISTCIGLAYQLEDS
jgi:hypothetical protein